MSARFSTSSARVEPRSTSQRAGIALNSAVPAMGSGLPPVALVIVLAVIFVPAGHFLLLGFLLLPGILVNPRGFRRLLLRLIEILVLLSHVVLLKKAMCDVAEKTDLLNTLSLGSDIRFIDRPGQCGILLAGEVSGGK